MERRRRQHLREETADERLDRLIEMEKRAKEQQTQAPEVKRLTVTEGGGQASGGGPGRSEMAGAAGEEADGRAFPTFQFGSAVP